MQNSHGSEAECGAPRAVRVLIVDDYPDNLESMALLLRIYGHHVEIASSGHHALSLASKNPPDVVLCDISMPGMSGLEVARQLRAMFPKIRLVAITACGFEEDRKRCDAAGFDRYFVKPANPEDVQAILQAVGQHLQTGRGME
jgi:CheY-like chemotaxis protein